MIGFVIFSVILFFGIPGNIISIVVWAKGDHCSKSSSAIYFKLIGVCDLLVLIVPGIDYFMFFYPWDRMDLRVTNDFFCKFFTAAFFISVDITVGITIALTIQRALTISFPIRSLQNNVHKRAYVIFVVIVCVAFILSLPYIIAEKVIDLKYLETNSSTNSTSVILYKKCTYPNETSKYIKPYNTAHFSCHVIIPIIILTICNGVILRTLYKDRNENLRTDCQTIKKSIHTVTALVICISFVHILSTLPMTLHVINLYYEIQMTDFWVAFSNLIIQNLIFLNSGINCVLYCFIGREFRTDLRKMCVNVYQNCRRKDRDPLHVSRTSVFNTHCRTAV
jgi:hypothetical protein